MRTTLVIDDELYRQLKAKAALEGRKVTELVEEGMRSVLGKAPRAALPSPGRRVRLPILPAGPGDEPLFGGMTLEEIHERLDALQCSVDRERVGSSP